MMRFVDRGFYAFIAVALILILAQSNASAQSETGLWAGAGLKKDLPKGMNAEFDAEWRQTGFFTETDRWSVGASFSKRLYRNKAKSFNVRADVGYKFLSSSNQAYTVDKRDPEDYGEDFVLEDDREPQYYIDNSYDFNLTKAFMESRHRVSASLSASFEAGRFEFSVRERVQYTYSCGKDSIRERHRFEEGDYDMETGEFSMVHNVTLASVGSSEKTFLRSRISVEYDIPHFKLDPFVSYEIFSDMNDGLAYDKGRVTAGAGITFKKKHSFEFAYIWQDHSDDDEPVCSAVSVNYTFKF